MIKTAGKTYIMQSITAESERTPLPLHPPSSEVDQTVNRRCPHRPFIWNPVSLYTKDHYIYNYTTWFPVILQVAGWKLRC